MGDSNKEDIINDMQPSCEDEGPTNWPKARGTKDGDLNHGAGGCYLYLYYQKIQGNVCISELQLGKGSDYLPPQGYSVFGKDLSDRAGGEYFWLVGKKNIIKKMTSSTTKFLNM